MFAADVWYERQEALGARGAALRPRAARAAARLNRGSPGGNAAPLEVKFACRGPGRRRPAGASAGCPGFPATPRTLPYPTIAWRSRWPEKSRSSPAPRAASAAPSRSSSPRPGCDVAVNYYNSADEADALCAEIRALGRRAVRDPGERRASRTASTRSSPSSGKHFDRLDIVVSNAASGVLKPTIEMTLKHWRWCMETNALALNLLAQRGLPLMPDGGRIVAHVEPRRVARDARLRLRRRVEGGARVARARARAGARAARHPRQRRQRRRRRHRRARLFPEPRGAARRLRAAHAGRAGADAARTSPAPSTCSACPKRR